MAKSLKSKDNIWATEWSMVNIKFPPAQDAEAERLIWEYEACGYKELVRNTVDGKTVVTMQTKGTMKKRGVHF